MLKIKTIPHKKQRYDCLDDWTFNKGGLEMTISETGKLEYDVLLTIHGLFEAVRCKQRGICEEDVAKFDRKSKDGDPGNNPKAPYHEMHMEAEALERIVARMFNVSFQE